VPQRHPRQLPSPLPKNRSPTRLPPAALLEQPHWALELKTADSPPKKRADPPLPLFDRPPQTRRPAMRCRALLVSMVTPKVAAPSLATRLAHRAKACFRPMASPLAQSERAR
jgi:hypothetical protein